jgi:hypothetical protein
MWVSSSLGGKQTMQSTTESAASRIEVSLQPPSPVQKSETIEAITVGSWPLAAIIIVLLLRRGISDALKGLSERATKVSFGQVSVELAETRAQSLGGIALDGIRDTASSAAVADSSGALVQALNDDALAEYAIVNIGNGREWITSRLYAVVAIVAPFRGLNSIVFTRDDSNGPIFLGIASVSTIISKLKTRYPWLDIAYIEGCTMTFRNQNITAANLNQNNFATHSPRGSFASFYAGQIFQHYKTALQAPAKPQTDGWEEIRPCLWERAEWVTPTLLSELLGANLIQTSIEFDLKTSDEEFSRLVLHASGDFVPVTNSRNRFEYLVNRKNFVDRTVKAVINRK